MGEINENGEIIHQIVETESEQNVTIIDSPLSSDISYLCKSLDINPKIVYFPGSGVLKLGPIFSAETKVIYFDDTRTSILRFCARPSSVSFVATGYASP